VPSQWALLRFRSRHPQNRRTNRTGRLRQSSDRTPVPPNYPEYDPSYEVNPAQAATTTSSTMWRR
jgi:hypothetical protein